MPYVPYSPKPLAPPDVIVVPPPEDPPPAVDVGTIVGTATPTISGTAGDRSSDSLTITVEVLQSGSVIRSQNTFRSGANWSVTITNPLPNGAYQARARQAWTGGEVVSVADPFTVAVPGTSGFAVSQGPTGSFFGPDANTTSGRPSILPRQMAKGGYHNGSTFTQFAQASDFWYSVGINHKPEYITSNQTQWDLAITRTQALRITKFRFGLWTPTNHTDTSIQNTYQSFGIRCRTLSTSNDPVMCLWGIGKEPASAVRDNGNQERWRYTPTTVTRPFDHMSGPNPTANQDGGGGPGNYQDMGWTPVAALQGPNEPDTSYAWQPSLIRTWCRDMRLHKNTRLTEDALSVYGYVDSTTGRWVAQQAKANQVPMVGPPLGSKTNGSNTGLGDWTARDESANHLVDYGSWSIYHYLEPHLVPTMVGYDMTNDGSEWNSFLNFMNGSMGTAGRFNRMLPIVVGETGIMSAPGADPVGAEVASSNNAPRYIPPEVAGIYINQSTIQHYCCMAKQQHIYKLCDEGFQTTPGAPAHGLCETDFRPKESYFQVMNFRRLLGRGQSSTPASGQPISIPIVQTVRNGQTITGWSPGSDNVDSLFPNTRTIDQLWRPVLQQDDDTYVMVLARNRPLWKRYSQVYITVPDPDDITFQLPAGDWTVQVAEPEKITQTALDEFGQTTGQKWPPTYTEGSRRALQDPDDGQNYPNPGDGMAWSSTGIAGVDDLTPDANNRITVRVAGLTRLVKITRGAPLDAYQTRIVTQLDEFASWVEANGVKGVIGEFGVPGNPGSSGYVANDAVEWAGLLGAYMDALESRNLGSLYWAAWPTPIYELSAYNATGIGQPVGVATAQAAPLEAHLTDTQVRGIAIAGLSFGNSGSYSNTNPGTVNAQYFPAPIGTWTYLRNRGWRTARLDFTWERLQPTLGGNLNGAYLALIQQQVDFARTVGMRVVLDLHNYGGYATSSGTFKLGSAQLTSAHFADLWARLAVAFKNDDTVLGYELMNEPEGLPGGAATWETASVAAYNAIRNGALDPDTEIWVAGHNFQKVQGWTTQHPDAWLPTGDTNIRYVAHHYFDSESSPGGKENSVYQGTSSRGGNYTYGHGVLDAAGSSPTGPPDAGAYEYV